MMVVSEIGEQWSPHTAPARQADMPIPMFCPNCGKMNYGYKGIDEKIKYECDRCMVKFVRVRKGRRHDTIEMFAISGQESIIRKF